MVLIVSGNYVFKLDVTAYESAYAFSRREPSYVNIQTKYP
jgi:hypothetical protein